MPKPKKQLKKSRIRSAISLSSTKGKLILFLLIFAVVGGGYMLYRSYAASYNFSITGPYVYAVNGENGSKATVVRESYGSKSGSDVVALTIPANWRGVTPASAQTQSVITGRGKTTNVDYQLHTVLPLLYTKTRTCITARVPFGTTPTTIYPYNTNAVAQGIDRIFFSGADYHKACGAWRTIAKPVITIMYPSVTIGNTNWANGSGILIYSIDIEAM